MEHSGSCAEEDFSGAEGEMGKSEVGEEDRLNQIDASAPRRMPCARTTPLTTASPARIVIGYS